MGFKMTPRPYQVRALDELWTWFETEFNGNPIVEACVGAGKSPMIALMCQRALREYPQTRILVLTHQTELLLQNLDKIRRIWPEADVGVCSAELGKKVLDRQVTYATIGSVYRVAKRLGHIDLVFADECFVGETMVSTPTGPKRIDSVRCGDAVYNQCGLGVVTGVSARSSRDIYKLEFDDGSITHCTGEHPFFVASGWKAARELEVGESFFSIEGMRLLWEVVRSMDQKIYGRSSDFVHAGDCLEQAKHLLSVVLKETSEPDEQSPIKAEDEGQASGDQAQTYSQRRQRAIVALSSARAASRAWGGVGVGVSDKDGLGVERLSELLQAGHRERIDDDLRRTGRGISRVFGKKATGRKKDRSSCFPRLVGISRVEREGSTAVFNLQVSGHPSYFADGKVVHNCHMVPSEEKGMWRKTITILKSINKNVRVIGWTGTPFRGNGIWLTAGKDPIFTHIATRVTMSELLGLGYLAPLVTEKTGINIDASQVGVSGDDYKIDELDAVMNDESVIAQTCADIIQRTKDRSRILVYCVTIDHANNVRAKLAELGMDAEVVTSESAKADKDRAISRFREGRLRCIVNVAMLTTGFDVPQVDCICLLRPTKSPVLYVQIGGRGMRVVGADIEESKALGKSDCLWLDYTMTTIEQGPIDRIKGRKPRNAKPGEAPFKICDNCGNSCALSAKVCPACGFEFPVGPEVDPHGTKPSDAPILSKRRDVDGKKEWLVTNVTYHIHSKIGGTIPTMRVTYWAGAKEIVSEWVALSHDGYGRMIAEKWWKDRSNIPQIPRSVQEAMEWISYDGNILARPTMIKTMKDDKDYERVVEYQWGASPAAIEGGLVEDQQAIAGGNGEVPQEGALEAAVDPSAVRVVRLLGQQQDVPQVEDHSAT